MKFFLNIIWIIFISTNQSSAAAIAKSLKCKSIFSALCVEACKPVEKDLPTLIVDQGNRVLTKKTDNKELSFKILEISKNKLTNGTFISYEDKDGIMGTTYITELRIFNDSFYEKDQITISTGSCEQK